MGAEQSAVGDGGPHIIPKNAAERVELALSTYKRHELVSLRVFWTNDDGAAWHPSKRGFALHAGALPDLIAALRRLEREAMRRGWIEECLASRDAPDSAALGATPDRSESHGACSGRRTRAREDSSGSGARERL